jgi:hypothetical protein
MASRKDPLARCRHPAGRHRDKPGAYSSKQEECDFAIAGTRYRHFHMDCLGRTWSITEPELHRQSYYWIFVFR